MKSIGLPIEAARHEIGHALIAWHIVEVEQVIGIWVLGEEGITRTTYRNRRSAAFLWATITGHLGGIAAEAILSNQFRPGKAETDLELAREACTDLRLFAPKSFAPWKAIERSQLDLQEAFTNPLPEEECTILNQCLDKARAVIARSQTAVEEAAQKLARAGHLSGADLVPFFGDRRHIVSAQGTRSGLLTLDP